MAYLCMGANAERDMRLNVLQLGKFHPIRGGVEKVMITFAEALSAQGIRCDMLCASADGSVEEIPIGGLGRVIKTHTLTSKAATMISPDMITKLREICHDYDIIHIHHPDPMAALALFLSGYRGCVVLHWHSDIVKQKFLLWPYRPLQKWLISRAHLILGTTPVYVQETPYLADVQHKTDYLPIGVPPRYPKLSDVERIRNQYPNKKIVYSMGRLVEYKGYEYLVEAASLLSDDYVVLIGGKGPLRESLEQQIKRLGLEGKVHLLGYVPEELEDAYYGASKVFCLSSTMKTEAYAIVQVEAMSVGCPVVATRISGSGVSWVNGHGESGLNVSPKSAQELAEAIMKICSCDEYHQQLSQGAKKRYERLFSEEKMITGLLNYYQQILTKNNTR